MTHARFLELVGAVGAPCAGNYMGGMLLLVDAGSPAPLLRPEKIVSIAGGGALLTASPHVDAYVERRRESSLAPGAWEAVAAARFRRPADTQVVSSPTKIPGRSINLPTLIIAGANDKLKPAGWWDALADTVPASRCVVTPESGHCPQLEKPDLVNTTPG